MVECAADIIDCGFVVDAREILVDVETDHGDIRLRRRTHFVDVANREKFFFELRGDESLDLVGGSAGPLSRDDDLVECHIVEVLNLGELKRIPAANHADDEKHIDEHCLPNTELGKRHRAITRMPLRSWPIAETATRWSSSRPLVISMWCGRKGTGRVATRTRLATSPSSTTKT